MSPSSDVLAAELQLFHELKTRFITKKQGIEIDPYGLKLQFNKTDSEVDIMVCGLTHGDEVIGLQIINLLLKEMIEDKKSETSNYNWIFLLNNLEAYHAGKRFIDFDLNRSFAKKSAQNIEFKRAGEIEKIIKEFKPRLIIDLHQTVEPTEALFAVFPEHQHLIQIAAKLTPDIEIVSFPKEGFSNLGQTLTEFAVDLKIPALVYELGHKGFISNVAENFKNVLNNIKLDEILEIPNPSNKTYWHIEAIVPNINEFKMCPDFISFKKMKENQILAQNDKGESFKSPFDGRIIFPRYQNVKTEERALAYLARAKQISADI